MWAEIGEYLDEGLVEGIKSGANTILRTTANLAKSVNGSLELESPEIGGANSSVMSGIDALSGTFSGFIDSLKAIANTFATAGAVPVPAVAAGTALPYKVRANTYTAADAAVGLSEGLQTSMTDQTDLLSDVDYKLGELIGLVKSLNLNLNIDFDSMTRSITYAQRTHERNFGGR